MVLQSFSWPDPTLSSPEGFKGHNFDMVSYPNGSMDFIETYTNSRITLITKIIMMHIFRGQETWPYVTKVNFFKI